MRHAADNDKICHKKGKELEDDFTYLADEVGFTVEDAKSTYNQNMMGGGWGESAIMYLIPRLQYFERLCHVFMFMGEEIQYPTRD
jgi:hypothetical protein